MFAGPNGSGKSTAQGVLPPELLGVYVNPDDLEAAARRDGTLDLSDYGVAATGEEVRAYLTGSPFLQSVDLAGACAAVRVADDVIDFGGLAVTSYHASVLSDFVRRKLLRAGVAFSFETVMSAPDKVELLKEARAAGYRTYLYLYCVRSLSLVDSVGGQAFPPPPVVEPGLLVPH